MRLGWLIACLAGCSCGTQDAQVAGPAAALPQMYGGGFQMCLVAGGFDLECQMIDQMVFSTASDRSDAPDLDVRAVGPGYNHTCAIGLDGALSCWGASENGALVPPAGAYVEVVSGSHFSCASDAAGAVRCWGNDDWGQLAAPAAPLHGLAALNDAACGLQEDGKPLCWGRVSEKWFVPAPDLVLARIDAAGGTACGLDAEGSIHCWGRPNWGLLEDVPAGTGWQDVEVGGKHVCALAGSGTLTCWGQASETSVPRGTFTQIAAGYYYTCGMDESGEVSCAGCSAGSEDGWCSWR